MSRLRLFVPQEPLVPERFAEARLARGLSMGELAEKIGITRQSISKYELGVSKPTDEVLYALADELKMPVSFFQKPLKEQVIRGTTFYRSQKTKAEKAKNIIFTQSKWVQEIASFLSDFIVFPQLNLPSLSDNLLNHDSYSPDIIEQISLEAREHWHLGKLPIKNLTNLLEKNGFIIGTIHTGYTEADACSSIINGVPYIFHDLEKECAVRTRFNLAHELGHIVLHQSIGQEELNNPQTLKRIENEANTFASCFLLPKETFLSDIRSTSIDSFVRLKQKWMVSIQAMVRRCNDLGIFSENQYIYIQKQISQRRWKKKEPFDDEWKCENPILLKKAITMMIEQAGYTANDFLEIFRLSGKDIEQICNLPIGTLTNQSSDNIITIDFKNKTRIDRN